MNFEEFKNKYFEGNDETAIECIAKELNEGFDLVSNASQCHKIIASFSDEQLKLYRKIRKQYNILDFKKILSCDDAYRTKRKGMFFLTGFGILFWCFVLMPLKAPIWLYIIPPAVAIFSLCLWVIRKNSNMKELYNGNFFITKLPVSYKHVKEDNDSDGLLSYYYYIHFPNYGEYEITNKDEYDRIKYGDEYFLVILEYNKKIQEIFSADLYELSKEFHLNGDKYLINK